jgi:hypothetical protein
MAEVASRACPERATMRARTKASGANHARSTTKEQRSSESDRFEQTSMECGTGIQVRAADGDERLWFVRTSATE